MTEWPGWSKRSFYYVDMQPRSAEGQQLRMGSSLHKTAKKAMGRPAAPARVPR